MPTIQTYELCAEGLTAHLKDKVAERFGLNRKTIEGWCRPKESDLNPTGTGKGNPLDQVERLIRIVHQSNPGNARQQAQYFSELCDELDREAGMTTLPVGAPGILNELREVIKESADISTALVGAQLDVHRLRLVRREIADERAALERLDAAVNRELERLGMGAVQP